MFGIRQFAGPLFGSRVSLRTSLALLVLVPSVSLAGLGGYAASASLDQALQLRAEVRLIRSVGVPAYEVLASLQEERRLTSVWLAEPSASNTALDARRRKTDAAIEEFRRHGEARLTGAQGQVGSRTRALRSSLDDLARQRAAVDSQIVSQADAARYYSRTVTLISRLQRELSRTSDGHLARGTAAVAASVQVGEMISQEDALLSAALVTGRANAATRRSFAEHVAGRRVVDTAQVTGSLPGRYAAAYEHVTSSPQWAQMVSVEDAMAGRRESALPPQADSWRQAADRTGADLWKLNVEALGVVLDEGAARANGRLVRTFAGGAAGLLVLVLSGFLLARVSGSLRGRMSALRETVREADAQLPEIAALLERGQDVDVPDTTLDQDWRIKEVGELAADIAALRRTAEDTVVQQAQAGKATTRILVNLARRTQILVHREISMLDAMERTYEDPELLEKLFAVDHTATRVRRHAENLLLLAGSHLPQAQGDATALVDVLRSAVSEIEDYSRVTVAIALPRVSLAGPAGTDVIHLVAELLENGAFFSPPHTKVELSAEETPNGLVIEIEDRGLGMKREDFASRNELLANPPVPETVLRGKDARLGLFVVARLAQRHGIEVSLRRSRYGGTCAVVLLPKTVIKKPRPATGFPGLPVGARVVASSEDPAMDSSEDHRRSGDTTVAAPTPSADLPSLLAALSKTQGGSDTDRSERSATSGGGDAEPAEHDVDQRPSQPVTDRGFPKRIRGASLAAPLRQPTQPDSAPNSAPNSAPGPEPDPAPNGGGLSLEQVTAALAAMQRGSAQARAAASPAGQPDGRIDTDSPADRGDKGLSETPPHTRNQDADEDPGR